MAISVATDTVSANTPPSRTRYARTDATTEYIYALPSNWMIYNPNTSQFFVSDPQSNHIVVMDAATEKKVATISVPGAYGLDDTPDHSTLYVGTLMGDVYTIDTASLTVTHRYVASQIGANGYQALSVLVLASGSVALQGAAAGLDPPVDGSASPLPRRVNEHPCHVRSSTQSDQISRVLA